MVAAVSGLLKFVGRDGNRSHKLSILLKSPVAKAPGFLFVRKISNTKERAAKALVEREPR